MENRDLQSVFGEDYQNLVVVIQELLNEVADGPYFQSVETHSRFAGTGRLCFPVDYQ